MSKMKQTLPCVYCAPQHPNPRLTCDGSCFQTGVLIADHTISAMNQIANLKNKTNDGNSES